MVVNQGIDRVQEGKNLTIVLEKINNGLIQSGHGLIFVVLTGIMGRTAIEVIPASVTGLIDRQATLKGERVDRNNKTASLKDRFTERPFH